MVVVLRQRKIQINYNEDHYYDRLGVFETQYLNKYQLIDCILDMISYIHSDCPNEQKAEYFMMCADLSYEFVVRFPIYKKFKHVFLQKMAEMLDNPFLDEKMKNSIRYYIDEIRDHK